MLRIALFIVALVAGGGAAWIVVSMRSDPAPVATIIQPETPVAMQDVLVTSADLGLGQTLTKESMRWQSWPESAVIEGYIVRSTQPDAMETLANSFVSGRMSSGEPVRDDKLVRANAGFLSTMLPSGKRAIAVRIAADSSAGGFILPNDRVDVLLTIGAAGKSEYSTRTILRNVPVLAIDQTVDDRTNNEKSKGRPVVIGKTATLELDPSQVEILISSQATGGISLALRSAADIAERPPLTHLQSSQSVRRFRIGSIEVIELVTFKKSVEISGSKKILGPAWAPGQVTPNDLQQAQQQSSGGALQ
ncbi:MAG: pilus assembly protein CpaB [Alphaproteobacteria bacterium]|nr:pilus assembly protein CpaB [Alphaproteobacteria bacterium]